MIVANLTENTVPFMNGPNYVYYKIAANALYQGIIAEPGVF